MNKAELEQLKSTVKQWLFHTGSLDPTNYANELKLKFIEPREKRIAELEEKISVLFSCKNCPENKGGFICVKEYENKCLAQKIQYIKELQEENAVLERRIERAKECMKKLLFIINSDPANYNCKGLVQDAEDFIHNQTCNIRQQGQHCITEERCIMCDK